MRAFIYEKNNAQKLSIRAKLRKYIHNLIFILVFLQCALNLKRT